MEGFITGDRGPEAFYQAQDHVWKIIEERHYPSFLVALTCRTTVGRQPASCEPDGGGGALKDRNFSWKDVAVSEQSHDKAVVEWSEQHQQARTRIEQLDARLTVKVQVRAYVVICLIFVSNWPSWWVNDLCAGFEEFAQYCPTG